MSSAPTNAQVAAAPVPAPPKEERRGDPHGKRPMDPTREAVGQSSNTRRRSHDEMEAQAGSRPDATVLDLYRLEQGPEEPLRRFVWRFRGVIVRIPPADLQEISVIAVFHANLRNPMMREKLRTRTVASLEELWAMADKCARVEEATSFPLRGAR